MRHLDLDFIKTRPASPWMRWLLVTIALGFTTDLGMSFHTQRARLAQNKAAFAELRHTEGATRAVSNLRAPTSEELRVARDTIDRLATPWNELFRALEAAASERVTLLAIDPQTKAGTVLISGEATDYRAALDYVIALSDTGTLVRPHLVRHERNDSDPQHPVRFAVSANWSGAK